MTAARNLPDVPPPNLASKAKCRTAAAPNALHAQDEIARHAPHGVGGQNVPPPIVESNAMVRSAAASNGETGSAQKPVASHVRNGGSGPLLADPTLGLCSDVVDDLEGVRIANENRLRTLTAVDETGHGLTLDHPDVKRLAALVEQLKAVEHQAVLNMRRVMRKHPFAEFVAARPGLGEKQTARLLAVIRDPFWNDLHDRPRKLRELYAFAGMHVLDGPIQMACDGQGTAGGAVTESDATAHFRCDSQTPPGGGVAPARQRGARGNWSPEARKRLWLIATQCVITRNSPYRAVYDEARIKYSDSVHSQACKRCGPSGKPAAEGSPLSAGHQHARAVRFMAKRILRDLWEEARRLHADV